MHVNLRWWLPYRFLAGLHFWYPIFFLYFLARLPLVQVLQLEAIYYACVVLLEVPSGWFSDRIGRRPTLLISKAAHVVSALLFAASGEGDFVLLAAAQLFLAAGFAFTSGTDAAFLHDTLQSSAGERYERLEPGRADWVFWLRRWRQLSEACVGWSIPDWRTS